MIYTSYFDNIKNLPLNDVVPVSICLKIPNDYEGIEYKTLAPKEDFFNKWEYKTEGFEECYQNNDYYIESFYSLVLDNLDLEEVVNELYELSKGKDIVLICYEKPELFCHRHLVAAWLRDNGYECIEWDNSFLKKYVNFDDIDTLGITNEDFVELHNHTDRGSNIRMKDSTVKVEHLIQYANDLGHKAVAITDHESLSAHVLGINTLNELKEKDKINKDFKLILGNEIYLVSQEDMQQEHKKFYHFILLAKDKKGHEQLRKLSTRAWRDNFFNYRGMQRVPTYYSDIEEVIGEDKGHLIASSGCLGSLFGTYSQLIDEADREGNEDLVIDYKSIMADHIEWCIDMFGEDNFYLEMQPNRSLEQVNYNKLLVNIAKAYDLNMIITTDVHYLNESKRESHKAFLTSDEKEANREVDDFYETTRFFDVKEIFYNMDYLDKEVIKEAILNTKRIADKCEEYDWFSTQKVPKIPLPSRFEWYKVDEDLIKDYPNLWSMYIEEKREGNYGTEYHKYLIHQLMKGIETHNIPKEEIPQTLERLEIEMGELLPVSDALQDEVGAYMVTMQKNMEIIWEYSLVGCGRGSCVCWMTNYLMDLSQLNPLKQGMELPHWRFLNKSRIELPDIDIDYSSHLKNTVFKAVKNYYESIGGTAVRIATFKTETAKSASLSACRGLHINGDIAQYISSLIKVERGKVWSITDMYYGNPKKNREPNTEFINMVDKFKDKNLLQAMLDMEGLVSGISSHASGILTLTEPLENLNSYMRTPSGELITCWDLHESEQCQATKFDFLLTNGISLLQLALEMLVKYGYIEWQGSLKATYDKYLHPEVINRDSKELWDLICQGKIMNLFQFETPVGSEAIKKLQPRSLIDLANANSLMRLMNPNGEQPLDKYIRFRNNPQLWDEEMIEYGLSDEDRQILHKELDNQCGVCSNQESMMMMFMNPKISDFSIKEANLARKAIAKKDEKSLNNVQEIYYNQTYKLQTDKALADYCWEVQTGYQKGLTS